MQEVCCPEFDPAPWDGKTVEWREKPFIKNRVRTLAYVPLNFAGVMRKVMRLIDTAGVGNPDCMALSDHTSPWNMDVYLAVDKDVPGAENVTLSGTMFSEVYEGPFQETKAWCRDFEATVTAKGLTVEKWYMWYTTCPKCAKKYGKNYVVILGKVDK